MVERSPEKAGVGGSNPSLATIVSFPIHLPHAKGNSIIQYTTNLNPRLQPSQFVVAGPAQYLNKLYNYNDANGKNNGNVIDIQDWTPGYNDSSRSQFFEYDWLNRIKQAAEGPIGNPSVGRWGQAYSIDVWGNLTKQIHTKGVLADFDQTADANNRIVGYCYDAAGNLLKQGACGTADYTYDGENRIKTAGGYTYTYDANGMRVRKQADANNFTEYIYFGSQVIAERDQSNTWTDYVFAGGKRIAKAPGVVATSGTEYYHSDHLGSARLMTNASGGVVTGSEATYLPYGQEYNATPTPNHYKFTGKERDAESGLDYFGARYYGSNMGRWLSPDWSAEPVPIPYGTLTNPQSLNLYQYVLNNPLSQKDDDGHEIIYADGLKNAQQVKDTVQAILSDPHTSGNLSGYVGPNNPNLTIQSGDLSKQDTVTKNADGTVTTTTVQGQTEPDIQTSTITSNGVTSAPETTLTGATITIDNRTNKGDTTGVIVHESVHAGEASANPAQFSKDAKAEKSLPHDQRPQEQRANAAQKAYTNEIKKEVKQIEKDRKKENQ